MKNNNKKVIQEEYEINEKELEEIFSPKTSAKLAAFGQHLKGAGQHIGSKILPGSFDELDSDKHQLEVAKKKVAAYLNHTAKNISKDMQDLGLKDNELTRSFVDNLLDRLKRIAKDPFAETAVPKEQPKQLPSPKQTDTPPPKKDTSADTSSPVTSTSPGTFSFSSSPVDVQAPTAGSYTMPVDDNPVVKSAAEPNVPKKKVLKKRAAAPDTPGKRDDVNESKDASYNQIYNKWQKLIKG